MRLLNVNNYHYRRGGAETIYLDHGALFADAGWDVDWFSMRHPRNPPATDDAQFADLIDLEHVGGPFARAKAAAAIVYNRDAARKIDALVEARRPDVAHLHNIYHHLSPSVLSALKRRGVPTVLTAHDLKLACPSYRMLAPDGICERCRGGRVWNVAVHRCVKGSRALSALVAVESAVHRLARLYRGTIDRVVAPSLFYRDKLVQWGWPAERIAYIPNFTTLRTDCTPIPADAPLVYVGRLSQEKGICTLIRAALLSGVRVRIVGTGPAEADLHAQAGATGAPVIFEGHCTGDRLEALVKESRALVLPSEWYENAPVSVMEAYALCRPVLGADIGGIPELIEAGTTGWIVPPGDAEALAAAMRAVADMTPAALTEMGRAGAAMAAERFSADAYLARMTALYHGLGLPGDRP